MTDQIKATDLFSNWAKEGKDQRMANTHAPSVKEMLDHVLTAISSPFSFIDAGCGNGWVVRKVLENDHCDYAVVEVEIEEVVHLLKCLCETV